MLDFWRMSLFLRSHDRFKNGKHHIYWSLVENKRCAGGKVVQRQVLYLGEISQGQRDALLQVAQQFDPPAVATPCRPPELPNPNADGGAS